MSAFGAASPTYRCGRAARWLPRAAAAALLGGSMLVAFRFDALRRSATGFPLQAFLVLVGAALALWVLRSAAEVRVRIRLEEQRILFAYGPREAGLPLALADIERFEFDPPLGASRRLLPAAVLIDNRARAWRLPVVLESGAELIDAIVARSGREDLATWADSLALGRKMSRAGLVVALGYAGSALVVAAAIWFYVH